MPWRQHASASEQQIIIGGPAHARFEQVATSILIQTIKYAFRARLPRHEQENFDAHWTRFQIARRGPGARDVYVSIERHIEDLVASADDALGGHGRNATNWMNDRANELVRTVEAHLK